MGIKRTIAVLLGFFILFGAAYGQILDKDKMRSLRMKRKHPAAVYLTVKEKDMSRPELWTKERVWKSDSELWGSVWRGAGTWQPDASAQVDEIKAKLLDEAKKEGFISP